MGVRQRNAPQWEESSGDHVARDDLSKVDGNSILEYHPALLRGGDLVDDVALTLLGAKADECSKYSIRQRCNSNHLRNHLINACQLRGNVVLDLGQLQSLTAQLDLGVPTSEEDELSIGRVSSNVACLIKLATRGCTLTGQPCRSIDKSLLRLLGLLEVLPRHCGRINDNLAQASQRSALVMVAGLNEEVVC